MNRTKTEKSKREEERKGGRDGERHEIRYLLCKFEHKAASQERDRKGKAG